MWVKTCRNSLCATCFQLLTDDKTWVRISVFSQTETVMSAVEMNSAIVSQHCELEPQAHFKMKSVRIVRWMWRLGTQCVHSLLRWSATSFLLFFHHSLFLWMTDGAEWSTCSGSRDVSGWMNEWEHTQVFGHTNTHRNWDKNQPDCHTQLSFGSHCYYYNC